MKKQIAILTALATLPVLANTPPEITNVRASQRPDTKLVDIYYDAADADGDLLKVRIEISDNDGLKYSVPAFSLTGDIGEGVSTGTDKHIVWDAGTDWDGEYSDKMRVKVFAIDAQGFPGLEWGNEVPPGGFLLGQDGGAEGSGPSKHVNIPWSYWLSKYEITAQQYCDFLNAAYAAGVIERNGTTEVIASGNMSPTFGCPPGSALCLLGDDQMVRWNVNNYEVSPGKTNCPANVTWYGALAFARFYGYDLPTEAEWEKAARGPDNDDQDEHLCYPWGNNCSSAYANIAVSYSGAWYVFSNVGFYDGNQTPVGPDTINGYGLYDVIGNAVEWTRTIGVLSLESYPTEETLLSTRNLIYATQPRVIKGCGNCKIYWRESIEQKNHSCSGYHMGFRVVRRHEARDLESKSEGLEDFTSWGNCGWTGGNENTYVCTNTTQTGSWVLELMNCTDGIINGNSYSVFSGNRSWSSALYLPTFSRQIYAIRVHVKNTGNYYQSIYCESSKGSSAQTQLPANMSDFIVKDIYPVQDAENYRLKFPQEIQLDSVEVFTIPRIGQ